MIAMDEDALICDFAQTYGIYDYRGLPVRVTATLAAGLGEKSRIARKLSGTSISLQEALLAGIVDRLGLLLWMLSKDGKKGRNRPKSILDALNGVENSKGSDVVAFDSPEEFHAAWAALSGQGKE